MKGNAVAERIRIVLADDHPVVLDGLEAVLATQPDLEVVARAGSGTEAIEAARMFQPDVVLLDLEMPGLDGVEVLRRLRELSDPPRVLVFTAFDTDDRILSAVRAGAAGYLLKGTPRRELFEAVRIVHSGGSLLQPLIASKLMKQVREEAPETTLTARELEVLRLLARGLQNKEIASEISVTERTVKFHVSSVLQKLGAGNRTEAVSTAVRQGLIRLPDA